MMDMLLWILGGLAGTLVLLAYLGVPILIRNTSKQAAHPQLPPVDIQTIPVEAATFMRQAAEQLMVEGFTVVDLLDNCGSVPNVKAYLVLMINRTAGDMALIGAFYGAAPDLDQPMKLQALFHEFSSYFTDGSEISTLNTEQLSVFKSRPEKRAVRLPVVRDPRTLYEAHRKVVQRDAAGRTKKLPAEGREVEELIRGMQEDLEKQAKAGYLYLDTAQDAYRPTWLGAYMMTWKLMWPLNWIQRAQRDAQGRALLRSLGMEHVLRQPTVRTAEAR
jgi:hypothetical protein